MDRFDKIFIGVVALLGISFGLAMADTGFQGAIRTEVGSYAETRSVSVTSGTTTEIYSASVKRPDANCRNFSPYIIFIGSNAAGATLENFGFPIASSDTFNTGSMTGAIHAIAETGATTAVIDVRCWDGLVR